MLATEQKKPTGSRKVEHGRQRFPIRQASRWLPQLVKVWMNTCIKWC